MYSHVTNQLRMNTMIAAYTNGRCNKAQISQRQADHTYTKHFTGTSRDQFWKVSKEVSNQNREAWAALD